MSKSVVICKIAYYRPGDRERSSNRRHVEYIALKPEADRGDEASLHLGDEDYRYEPGKAGSHVEYASERPGSSGLFGPEDEAPDWRQVAAELKRHDFPTWRAIVSLREDDAIRLGLTSRADWEPKIRDAAKNVVKAMHLDPGRTKLVAAFHLKQGHPHVHIVIWESSHKEARRQGRLWEGERKAVWRAFAKELFRDERIRLMVEKTALRDAVRELVGNDVGKRSGFEGIFCDGYPIIPRLSSLSHSAVGNFGLRVLLKAAWTHCHKPSASLPPVFL